MQGNSRVATGRNLFYSIITKLKNYALEAIEVKFSQTAVKS